MNFKFIEFKQTRHLRGVEAAQVECIEKGENHGDWLWTSVKDIKANIREFGAHPELIKALNQYGVRYIPTPEEVEVYKEAQQPQARTADQMIEDMPITKDGILNVDELKEAN